MSHDKLQYNILYAVNNVIIIQPYLYIKIHVHISTTRVQQCSVIQFSFSRYIITSIRF